MRTAQVVGFEGVYEIREDGQIKTVKTGRILKANPNGKYWKLGRGYLSVHVRGQKRIRIHRALAEAFIPNPEKKPQVNHKDGDTLNNNLENLEWCTSSENQLHAFKLGLRKSMRGSDHPRSKLTEKEVTEIRARAQKGEKYRTLSEEYGVCYNSISNIMSRKTWAAH